jgi:crossover junction endodeoxyribonuclease RuvC
MLIFGIDPGLTGAIGVLRDGAFLAVEDMPTVVKGVGSVKYEISPSGLKQLFRKHAGEGDEIVAVLERVNSMPGMSASSVFSLGDSFGCARSVVATAGVELTYVTPQTWKKHFKLEKDKELSRALAIRMFPRAELHLKKHHDRAESLLMARWLWETRFA